MVLRIFKIIATSGFLTALQCTKFIFGRGSAPGPTGEAYSAPPDSLAGLRDPTSKREREGSERASERKGRGEVERKEKEGPAPFPQIPGSAPATLTLTLS